MQEEKHIPIDRYKSHLHQSKLIEYTVTIDPKGGGGNERNVLLRVGEKEHMQGNSLCLWLKRINYSKGHPRDSRIIIGKGKQSSIRLKNHYRKDI